MTDAATIDPTAIPTSDQPTTDQTLGGNPPVADHPLASGPTSAPPAHRSILASVGHAIEEGAVDIRNLVIHLPAVLKAWDSLAPQVKVVAVQIFHDVLKLEGLIAADVNAARDGEILPTIQLSEQTWGAIKQLISDAKSGEQSVIDSLAVLGIKV